MFKFSLVTNRYSIPQALATIAILTICWGCENGPSPAADASSEQRVGEMMPVEVEFASTLPSPLIEPSVVIESATCVDCDSPQGSCTPGNAACNNYCLSLVGEIGICHFQCNCCVCPEVPAPPPSTGDPTDGCVQAICRCDGVPGNQGSCPDGCREVGCI